MFCGACGHVVQAQNRFCPQCGREIEGFISPAPLTDSVSGSSQTTFCREQLIYSYISGGGMVDTFSSSFAHLQAAFRHFMAGGGVFLWNNAAFWTGIGVYLAYRKNYGTAFLFTVGFALALWLGILSRQLGITLVMVFVAHIVFAGLVDRLIYGRFLKEEQEAIKLFPRNSNNQISYLSNKGGVNRSVPGFIVGFWVLFVIAIIIYVMYLIWTVEVYLINEEPILYLIIKVLFNLM